MKTNRKKTVKQKLTGPALVNDFVFRNAAVPVQMKSFISCEPLSQPDTAHTKSADTRASITHLRIIAYLRTKGISRFKRAMTKHMRPIKQDKTSTQSSSESVNCTRMAAITVLCAIISASFSLTAIQPAKAKGTMGELSMSALNHHAQITAEQQHRRNQAEKKQNHVQVAGSGFFDPYATAIPKSRNSKYYKAKKKKKAKKKIKPQYALGAAKVYAKKYNQYNYNSYSYKQQNQQKLERYRAKKYNHSYSASTYRTMCVRVKDGYYWPINFAQKKWRLKKDNRKCQKSCSGEVRLYVYPSNGDIKKMRDLKGRPYSKLKTAYLYRTKYVKNAQCKPRPWSQEAKAKHQKYAINDANKKRKMHIRLMKRAEKKRVAALKRLANKIARKKGRRYASKKLRAHKKRIYANRRKNKYKNKYSANY